VEERGAAGPVAEEGGGDGAEAVAVLADGAGAVVGGEERAEGLVGGDAGVGLQEAAEEGALGEVGGVGIVVGGDHVGAGGEGLDAKGAVPVDDGRLAVMAEEEVGARRRPLAEPPFKEVERSAEAAAAEGLEGEEAAGGGVGGGRGASAVGYGDEKSVAVVAQPGAAAAEVASRPDAGLDLRGGCRGPRRILIAIRRQEQRDPRLHPQPDREHAHTPTIPDQERTKPDRLLRCARV
jgi:hypothetical protein